MRPGSATLDSGYICMVLEYMDRGTAQHLSKKGLLDLEGGKDGQSLSKGHCLVCLWQAWRPSPDKFRRLWPSSTKAQQGNLVHQFFTHRSFGLLLPGKQTHNDIKPENILLPPASNSAAITVL